MSSTTTTYREGIVSAIITLGNGSKGAPLIAIKKHVQGSSCNWNNHAEEGNNKFYNSNFLCALKKAEADGVITKHGRGVPSYKLSAGTKKKVTKNAEEFYKQCALEEEKEEEASEESSESEDEMASPEPEGVKDSDDSKGCKTSYREGIVAAIFVLGNGSKGEVSHFDIEKYLKGYSSKWNNNYPWKDNGSFKISEFLDALDKAKDDGVITKHGRVLTRYKLSTATKKKVMENAEEFYRQSALEEERENLIEECADNRDLAAVLLMNALDECHRGVCCAVVEDELSDSVLSKGLQALRPEHSMIIVPMVDSKWFSNGSDGLVGMDKNFQKYIDVASNGSWTVLAVEMKRVDSIEGNPNINQPCTEHEGDGDIQAIYDCDGKSMNTNILDNLKINWKKSGEWSDVNGVLVSRYPWRDNAGIWENGKVVEKACEDGEGVSKMFERLHSECFLVGLLKELVESK